jgi:hypothetical protein
MRLAIRAITAGAVICLAVATTAAETRGKRLGWQKVGFVTDYDVIRVGRGEGRFESIRLQVSGNKVYSDDVKVIYANGEPDGARALRNSRRGQTRALDAG